MLPWRCLTQAIKNKNGLLLYSFCILNYTYRIKCEVLDKSIITYENVHKQLYSLGVTSVVTTMVQEGVTYTENGAVSLGSTSDPRVDLFFKTTRHVGVLPVLPTCDDDVNKHLYDMIDASMALYPLDTMKILMNWRDCRGGKGDHRGFIVAIVHISKKYPEWFVQNYDVIPEYGSYLDLVKLWHYVESQDHYMEIAAYLADVLVKDLQKMKDNQKVSLVAKWLPSEGSKWDKPKEDNSLCTGTITLTKALSIFMSQDKSHKGRAYLRKEYISPLRKYIQLVETKMCAKEFDKIDYQTVPSVAMHKYRKAFSKNDKERFGQYLTAVAEGKAKINASQVYPHDLVRQYMTRNAKEDEVIEAQWKVLKENAQKSKAFEKSIVVCDVSGSMEGTPMEVAIALGLLGLYEDKLITFSANPTLHHVPNGTLFEQVKNVMKMNWGVNTNFERVMDLVLGLSARNATEAIKRIFIFSDMQFDVAMNHDTKTHFNIVRERFATAGIEMPQIVFWNLRGETKDFPVTFDEQGVVLMSGYSPALLTSLLDGKDITPLSIVENVIHSPRYDLVKAPTY
jgi:hypothetical protein